MGNDMKEKKLIAVDAGKHGTKVFALTDGIVNQKKMRTKISAGSFADDMVKRGTFVCQIDSGGPVYNVGNGARNEPAAETSKKSEIHRVLTLAAVARMLGEGLHENVSIAIGLPLDICENVAERLSYKEYILGKPGEMHTVRLKMPSNNFIEEVRFTFGRQLVYPEGIGALYKYPALCAGQPVGVIDIGHINTNCMYYNSFEPVLDSCFTDEMGGKFLISELNGRLSAELGSNVDDNIVASLLMKPYEDRYLVMPGGADVAERSRAVIDETLRNHVLSIRQRCRTRHWPIDFMLKIFIGGTSRLLEREIKEVFGESVIIADDAEFVNAHGFLKMLCAQEGIDLDKIEEEARNGSEGKDQGTV